MTRHIFLIAATIALLLPAVGPAATPSSAAAESKDAPAGGIEFFHGSFDEALAKAKVENKLVFIDVYTTWCGPCRMMVLNVFPQGAVGEFFNQHFVSLKLDSEDNAIKGPEIARRFGIRVLPTYLFINPDGTEKYRGLGFMQAEAFINLGRAALGDRRDLFSALDKRYQAGERSPEFIREYLRQANYAAPGEGASADQEELRDRIRKVFDTYIGGKDKKDLINGEDYFLMESYLSPAYRDDEYVDFIAHNYGEFIKVAPESQVAFFLLESVKHSVGEKSRVGDITYLKHIQELEGLLAPAYKCQLEVIKNEYVYKEFLEDLGRRNYLTATQDWQGMLDRARAGIAKKGAAVTARDYATVAMSFLSTPNPAVFAQAVFYAAKAYEMEPSASFAFYYVRYLQKLDLNAEALKVAEKELARSPADDRDPMRQRLQSLVTSLKPLP